MTMPALRNIAAALLLFVFLQGCRQNRPADPSPQEVSSPTPAFTAAPPPTPTPAPVILEPSPTPTPAVTITAVNGNLFIRRGPNTLYNQVGVLREGTSAEVIAQDVLSEWVQIRIPNSEATGWVSVLTRYSKVEGDLRNLPDFTFTDWPLPAYVKNCTEHDIVLEPGDIYLFNIYTNAQYLNELQVDPGSYTVHDMFLPGAPEFQKVDIKEGVTVYITVNGLGEKHKCP
jgi:hypothetical protein